VNIATLLIAGRPWGVTSAFALWGAKALAALNVSVETWPYWSTPAQRAALQAPIALDVTSVMDIGLVLGAMAAAGLAGRFAPAWRVSGRSAAAAVVAACCSATARLGAATSARIQRHRLRSLHGGVAGRPRRRAFGTRRDSGSARRARGCRGRGGDERARHVARLSAASAAAADERDRSCPMRRDLTPLAISKVCS
jgi:hypothetical protein